MFRVPEWKCAFELILMVTFILILKCSLLYSANIHISDYTSKPLAQKNDSFKLMSNKPSVFNVASGEHIKLNELKVSYQVE